MKQTKLELLVGVFVTVGIAAVAYLTLKLGAGALVGADSYTVEARFANVGGLNKGSSVMLSGVFVGRVEEVTLDIEDYSAIVSMKIFTRVQLPTDTIASIKTTGLIGDKYIALAPGADETYLTSGARITMTESAVDLESLIGKMAFGTVEEESTQSNEP